MWNKGGTSQGTSPVMHWNSFAGQGEPSGGARGPPKGPKGQKTAFVGHKQVWWLQTDRTVWNKGGTSQGTSPVMHWNSFAGQGGSKTAKNSLFRP